uniref:Ig-like domain-containing protein n=1 Tax=Oryzias melastigma TaxID=30732 RepID=A0A3B3DSG1_ORYME
MTPLVFAGCVTCLLLGTVAYSMAPSASLHLKSVLVGQEVTLKCLSDNSLTVVLKWYKQTSGQKPQLMSNFIRHESEGTLEDNFRNDPRFQLESGAGKNHLKISNAQTSDSATYFCVGGYSYVYEFFEAYSVHVGDSSSYIQTSVDQSSSENIHAGDSVTLNCTVHTGSCDGEHRVYWFKDSEDSHPGLIYTDRGRKDQCERKKNTQTHSCVYNLHMKNLTESHSGIYYCAVVSCGHILFGNGTKLDLTPNSWLVFFLTGSLTLMSVLVIFLAYKIKKQNCCPSKGTQTMNLSFFYNAESLHYAAVNVKRSNRSRRQKNNSNTECVYASVRQ